MICLKLESSRVFYWSFSWWYSIDWMGNFLSMINWISVIYRKSSSLLLLDFLILIIWAWASSMWHVWNSRFKTNEINCLSLVDRLRCLINHAGNTILRNGRHFSLESIHEVRCSSFVRSLLAGNGHFGGRIPRNRGWRDVLGHLHVRHFGCDGSSHSHVLLRKVIFPRLEIKLRFRLNIVLVSLKRWRINNYLVIVQIIQ